MSPILLSGRIGDLSLTAPSSSGSFVFIEGIVNRLFDRHRSPLGSCRRKDPFVELSTRSGQITVKLNAIRPLYASAEGFVLSLHSPKQPRGLCWSASLDCYSGRDDQTVKDEPLNPKSLEQGQALLGDWSTQETRRRLLHHPSRSFG